MKTVLVVQHSQSEHLGLLEHHLEDRRIAFHYCRPFVSPSQLPADASDYDGIFLLPGGPFGLASNPLLLTMPMELRLAESCLASGKPVIGFGSGAILLAMAAGGGAVEAPWRFAMPTIEFVGTGIGIDTMPLLVSLRDRPQLPADCKVLAREPDGVAAVFSVAGNCLGFTGNPAATSGMYEDLVMEEPDFPEGSGDVLVALRTAQADIAAALSPLARFILRHTGLFAI
jgi:GMP synthase (glutamine-hydrolysing)